MYLQNTVSIHPILLDLRCDMNRGDTHYTTILNQKRDFKKWQIYSL
ncbi:hypothetical protein Godav_028183 [Gossypium davidsonii]|uniref:Uncharacterized protein n=2 Tax=Gossypium TaxID=3633 RepID=A0A7J8RYN8_GOSDV|nr:hypothetical protein [Gossypium davidsonii]MBA0654295.1 hypothetical protein [Gossypium klotzschianum]